MRKNQIRTLLKGIETGDPASVAVVSTKQYIQHNPQTREGSEGLAALFARISKTSPRVNLVRVFSDGDFVFAHTEYDFATRKIGFEVFRFEGDYVVEHWDNIQERRGPNASRRSMVDGPTDAVDREKTEPNRQLVRDLFNNGLIGGDVDCLGQYLPGPAFAQHNADLGDGADAFRGCLSMLPGGNPGRRYEHLHRVLADGNFVLAASEGSFNGVHSAFYDLFRVSEGKLVEHWDTIEAIALKSEWKNHNGKF